jgi:HK97 family phage portal protein
MKWPWRRAETRATLTQRDLRLVEWLDGDRHFGQIVSAITTEWLSSASAAIDAIATTEGTLPAIVYRKTADGRQEDDAHPLARLIHDGPNDHQTWPDFVTWLVAETLRFGNGVAELLRDDAGTLIGLKPLPADRRSIMLLQNGRLAYDAIDAATLQRRRLLDGEVVHLRDRSDDGLIGRARHERASPVIAAALAVQKHSGALHQHGMWPNAAIELEGTVGPEGVRQLKEQLERMFAGPERAGKAIILPGGKWNPISGSPVDQELLLARRFAGEEAARVYGVPPPIIGDLTHGSFANVNDMIRFWAMGTIAQWARRIEAEFARSVFSRRTHELVIDLSGLLRGDPAQRWTAWKIAVDSRVLTPNEIRTEEGYNPRPAGDDFTATPTLTSLPPGAAA